MARLHLARATDSLNRAISSNRDISSHKDSKATIASSSHSSSTEDTVLLRKVAFSTVKAKVLLPMVTHTSSKGKLPRTLMRFETTTKMHDTANTASKANNNMVNNTRAKHLRNNFLSKAPIRRTSILKTPRTTRMASPVNRITAPQTPMLNRRVIEVC